MSRRLNMIDLSRPYLPDNRMAVYAKDVRNGDVLLEQRRAVIDHLEHDVDINEEPVVLLVPRGSDHTGYWYHPQSVVNIDRPVAHKF